MLSVGNTLHFINRVDDSNCGDKIVCPILYYYDYFRQYRIKRHDIRFIDFESISNTDVVIIGGGGLFDYAEFTNRAINKVLETGAKVIAWSPGFNSHRQYGDYVGTKINFDKFVAVTVRDFQNKDNLPYLADVTCKLPGLKKEYSVKRKFGVAKHKDYPMDDLNYDSITNDREIDEILQFIGESEIVISNSFHMIYWSLLMGKKTICADPFSSRFYSYQYKPEYFHSGVDNLLDCAQRAKQYDILDACIQENDLFFTRVKAIIEDCLQPVSDQWAAYKSATREVLLEERYREKQLIDGDGFISQLYVDTGDGFSDTCKLIAHNNVYGDEIHTVRFDLSSFDRIRALRFDPIDGYTCEMEILSATSAEGDIHLIPYGAVRGENQDRFLTTDPQYFIQTLCTGFLEIRFKLRLLTQFETECNIYTYTGWQADLIEQKSILLDQRDVLIQEQIDQMEKMDGQLAQQREQIEGYNVQIQEMYSSTSWKLTAPLRAVVDLLRRLWKGMR